MLCFVCFVNYSISMLLLRMKPQHQKSIVYKGLCCFFAEPMDSEHLREIKLAKVSTIIAFTNITYIQYASTCHADKSFQRKCKFRVCASVSCRLCKYSLAIFFCTELPSVPMDEFNAINPSTDKPQQHPRLVLSAYPELGCWEGDHWAFVTIGVLGVLVYLVGMPLAIHVILNYVNGNEHHMHTDRKTMLAFGVLYSKYRVSAWRYEIVQERLRCDSSGAWFSFDELVWLAGAQVHNICTPGVC